MRDITDPTNRDTVPAMLTPGEFVLNKEASQMYAPMIEQMNNAGLQQRHQNNLNAGGGVPQMAMAVPMYNVGGEVDPFDKYFEELLQREGGWSDHAADRGGKTNLGITLKTLKSVKPGATEKDLRNLTKDQAKEIYRKNYYEAAGISKLPESIRGQAFDIAVNSGPGRAAKFVQELTGAKQDGVIGPETLAAVDAAGISNNQLADRRQQFYDGIIANDPSQAAFQDGWTNRANSFRGEGGVPQQQATPPNAGYANYNQQDFLREANAVAPSQPSFNEAFASARAEQGAGGTFDWDGKSFSTDRADDDLNNGGPVHLNIGGWLKGLFGGNDEDELLPGAQPVPADPYAGYANYNQQDYLNEAETFNNPGAQATGYSVPEMSQPELAMPDTMSNPGVPEQLGNMGVPKMEAPGKLPPPNSDESLLQGSSQSVEAANEVPEMPVGSPERMAAIDAGEIEPTDADFDFEEQQYRLTQDLNQTRLNQAVQADDSLGAEFNAQREMGLMNDINALQAAPEMAAVPGLGGTDFNPASAPDGGFTQGEANQLSIPEMGGVPNVDTSVPVHNPSANTQMEAASRLEMSSMEIEGADSDILAAQEGINNATSVSEVERFQRAQAQATQRKKDAEAAQSKAAEDTGRIEAQTQLAADSRERNISATAEKVEAARESATAAGMSAPQKKDAAASTVESITQKVVESGESPEVPVDEAAAAETAGKTATPEQISSAGATLKEAFGDLFDKKELARAGILMAGAMITGMSPQRALAFAGRGYLQRIDAKEAMRVSSAAEIAKRKAEGLPVVDRSNPEEFVVDGKRVNTYTMKTVDPNSGVEIKTRILPDGTPLDASAHQNFDTVPGTSEYNKRVQTEAGEYAKGFKELQERFGTFEGPEGKSFATDLTPSKVGANSAKWAIANGVGPEAMPQLIDNAYAQARNDAKSGNRPKNIEAYLNSEYLQAKTGSAMLFEGAEPTQVNSLIGNLGRAAGGKSSTEVLQFARGKWSALPDPEKERYRRRAIEGQTPFMVYMQGILNKEI